MGKKSTVDKEFGSKNKKPFGARLVSENTFDELKSADQLMDAGTIIVTAGLGFAALAAHTATGSSDMSAADLAFLLTPAMAGLGVACVGVAKKIVVMIEENKMIKAICEKDPKFMEWFGRVHDCAANKNPQMQER